MKSLLHLIILVMTLSASGCSDEALSRSDTPISRVDALKRLDIPLPASAHNVYFLDYAGGMQDLERYIRFDVDPKELDSAVDALVAANNKMMSRALPYTRSAITSAELPPPRKEFFPIKWWDPSGVTKGYYRGHIDGYAFRILVDEGRSRIYINQNA